VLGSFLGGGTAPFSLRATNYSAPANSTPAINVRALRGRVRDDQQFCNGQCGKLPSSCYYNIFIHIFVAQFRTKKEWRQQKGRLIALILWHLEREKRLRKDVRKLEIVVISLFLQSIYQSLNWFGHCSQGRASCKIDSQSLWPALWEWYQAHHADTWIGHAIGEVAIARLQRWRDCSLQHPCQTATWPKVSSHLSPSHV
jgi:hypothetical protein